jgi:hypothetical protein
LADRFGSSLTLLAAYILLYIFAFSKKQQPITYLTIHYWYHKILNQNY